MAISKSILGMNARNFLYIRKYNFGSAKRNADDKLATKKLLVRHTIPTSKMIHAFESRSSLKSFNWDLPVNGFVVKPARGFGGEGILVFKKWENGIGETVSGQLYTIKQLQSHMLDIFEGAYSLQSLPDRAYIEERITPDPFFRKLTPVGLPDIRVIVFNMIPIMAMMRLPTEESRGKANIHMGALAIGIDLRTGITKHAIYKGQSIDTIPNTKLKTRGIKIPKWDEILNLAVRTQVASKLGYAGVDVVLDAEKGPLILEVNARPGLSIQLANMASLRSRLERVENLEITTVERGVDVAKSLFAEEFSEKVSTGPRVLNVVEKVTVYAGDRKKTYEAKVDTGAYRTSIDYDVVEEMKLEMTDKEIKIKSASGFQSRPSAKVTFTLGGKKITTLVSVAERSHLRYPIIIGRRDMEGFLVNPNAENDFEREMNDLEQEIEDDDHLQ